jgi:hypothetical protein
MRCMAVVQMPEKTSSIKEEVRAEMMTLTGS